MRLMNSKQTRTNASGFTLMELVVVLSIITLLAGLAIPAVSGLVTSQRYDECHTQLKRIGQAIMDRANFLANSYDFTKKLQDNAPPSDPTGGSNYTFTAVHYFPFQDSLVPATNGNITELNRLSGQLPNSVRSTVVVDGGPYISSAQSQFGSTAGSATNIYDDPWGRSFAWHQEFAYFPNQNQTALWRPWLLFSKGPNNASDPGDLSLRLNLHLYLVLAEATHKRIETVNKAILEYNKVNLPDRALNATAFNSTGVFWDRDPNGDMGTTPSNAYERLVAEGYLPRLQTSTGQWVDFYALDAWGYVLLSDQEAATRRMVCNQGSSGHFSGAWAGPVMRAVSGNLIAPGFYSGKSGWASNLCPDTNPANGIVDCCE